MHEVTALLAQARDGDKAAADRLFAAVYHDLRHIAARQLGRVQGDAQRATSLVHEAWFRLGRPEAMGMNDREHFFAVAARAMRQLIVDHARERAAGKRGGGVQALPLHEIEVEGGRSLRDAELLALDQAIEALRQLEPALAELVELRFFAGLEIEEVAGLRACSLSTVKRDWRRARAFLHAQLGDGDGPDA
jgi:RNA polymerase sigma factor (TIGR02999 family)